MTITIEYELDQWEWQGTTQKLEVNSEDFEGFSGSDLQAEIYARVCKDGQSKMHFVYDAAAVVNEITEAIS